MSKFFYAASGVLVLERLTPTVRALFGEHHLVDKLDSLQRVEFFLGTELGEPLWPNLLPRLVDLATERGASLPPTGEQNPLSVLQALASSFNVDHDPETRNILSSTEFEDVADVRMLFRLCLKFDDGHGLSKLIYQGSQWSDSPSPLAYGGNACFLSRHAQLFSDTLKSIETGELISRCVESGDLDLTARHIAAAAWQLTRSISDASLRAPVAARVAHLLPKLAMLG